MKLRATVTGTYSARRAAAEQVRSQAARASRHNVGRQVGRRLNNVIGEWRLSHPRYGLTEIVLALLLAFKKDLKLRGYLVETVNVPNHMQQLINDPIQRAELSMAMKNSGLSIWDLTQCKLHSIKSALRRSGYSVAKSSFAQNVCRSY